MVNDSNKTKEVITLSYKNIELIKNFNLVRDYMREFFVYGFKNRGDFDEKSGRTYDDRRRQIESWLGRLFQILCKLKKLI